MLACLDNIEDYKNFGHGNSRIKKTAYNKNGSLLDANSGKAIKRAWTTFAKIRVLEHSIPDSELAKQLRRSVGAIQTMRASLKKQGFDPAVMREELFN